jgi:hypothetical protein
MIITTPIILWFLTTEFEKPSIWLAIAAPILKNAWGLATASILIGFVHRYGWILYDLMSYSGYRITGRISYATLICHLFVIKLVMSRQPELLVLSDLNLVSIRTQNPSPS